MPSGLYTADDHATGYESNRYDRINATMQANNYGYDMPSTQTWNAGGFGGANTLGAMGATSRMKPSGRGRSALPSVRLDPFGADFGFDVTDLKTCGHDRLGLISNIQCPR